MQDEIAYRPLEIVLNCFLSGLSTYNLKRSACTRPRRAGDVMLNILIADDHAIIRKGLRDILRTAAIPVIVEEAEDGQEAVEKGLAADWDVVVLDITMPRLNGIDALKQLKQHRPDRCVVMLSVHADPHYI